MYEFKKERDVLDNHVARMGADGLKAYRKEKNKHSIDGIKGLDLD
jgi:hypothetical protein